MKPVLIIGAGPAGLAMAACLQQKDMPYVLWEKSEAPGDSWRRHYDRLHLHTVKEHSALPYLPFAEDVPRYPSRAQVVAYLEEYARHFGIEPHYGEEAVSIRRAPDGGWEVRSRSGRVFRGPAVVLGTGLNRCPHRPALPGEEQFSGEILHSRSYKNPAPFRGKRVLVIGMGNTGAEIALDLCEQGVSTAISVRSAVNIVPRDFWGRSTQKTALKLARLPHWMVDGVGVLLRKVMVGNLEKYGIRTPALPPSRQLRQTGKTPVIDIGTVAQIKAGRIEVLPGIRQVEADGVRFENGERRAFDVLLLATGYQPGLDSLLGETEGLVDRHGAPRELIGAGRFAGLYFLGFDNYSPGGILGVIHRDAPRVADHLQQQLPANGGPAAAV